MKMKSKYILMVGFSILCSSHVLRGQSSNSTSGGFMTQINSWISRLRGNNNSNNNNNQNTNSNTSDKEKETQNKGTGQQMSPVQYANVMPYPMMSGMPSMYGPMSPMTMSFGPRPMPSAAFAPAGIPFGSLAAGSSMGPNMGQIALGSSLGSSMASGLASPMASAMSSGLSSSYPQMSQMSGMRPSYSSASHMMPVHHDYPDSANDYQVGSYGSMPNSFSNSGFNGLSSSNYGSLGGSNPEQPISDSAYNGEQVEQNGGEEYSSSYHR